MCSTKRPLLCGPDADAAMLRAVSLVAERSFFSMAEPCGEGEFAEISGPGSRWLVGRVGFSESDCAGEVSCVVPEKLARQLFDAFAGRDPEDPAPASEKMFDLIGEFSNMVCGAWLTRLASDQTFTLTRPSVRWGPEPSHVVRPDVHLLLRVDGQPLAVNVRLEQAMQGCEP